MKNSFVSVIIPTFSRPDYLRRAIDSVYRQTWESLEVIVVDDNGAGSENQLLTEKAIDKYLPKSNFKYLVHSKNRRGAAARNTGLKHAVGTFITFLDDDDELMPAKIENQVAILRYTQSDVGAVYSGFKIVHNEKVLKFHRPKMEGNLQLELLKLTWGFGTGSNPLFKREVFDVVGGFDESFVRHQDWEFMVRFYRRFSIVKDMQISIVRYVDSTVNLPNVRVYAEVKSLFLTRFSNDIDRYSLAERRIIYRNQYADVAFNALLQNEFIMAFRFYRKAFIFKPLSIRLVAKAVFYFLTQRAVR